MPTTVRGRPAGLIGTSSEEFRRTWPWPVDTGIRPYRLALAYLVGGFSSLHCVGRFHRPALAWRLFGRGTVEDAAGQVSKVLSAWGYHGTEDHWESALCCLLLVNRSPFLHDLTGELLQETRASKLIGTRLDITVYAIHRALASLGYATPPLSPTFTSGQRPARCWARQAGGYRQVSAQIYLACAFGGPLADLPWTSAGASGGRRERQAMMTRTRDMPAGHFRDDGEPRLCGLSPLASQDPRPRRNR